MARQSDMSCRSLENRTHKSSELYKHNRRISWTFGLNQSLGLMSQPVYIIWQALGGISHSSWPEGTVEGLFQSISLTKKHAFAVQTCGKLPDQSLDQSFGMGAFCYRIMGLLKRCFPADGGGGGGLPGIFLCPKRVKQLCRVPKKNTIVCGELCFRGWVNV